MATIGADKRFVVWNIASGRSLLISPEIEVNDVLFLPDRDAVLSIGSDEQLRKWSLLDEQQIKQITAHEQQISMVTQSPDGGEVAVGGINGIVKIYNADTLDLISEFVAHSGGFPVVAAYYTPDGSRLYTQGGEGRISIWNPETGDELGQLEEGQPTPLGSAQSPDKTLLAVVRGERVNIYNLLTGERTTSFEIPPFDAVEDLQFSVDNLWLAIGGNIDNVTIFDITTGDLVVALRGHGRSFLSMAFSQDKSMILTGVAGGDAFLWNLSELATIPSTSSADQIQIPRAALQQVPGLELNELEWSPDSTYILLVGRNGGVHMFSVPGA